MKKSATFSASSTEQAVDGLLAIHSRLATGGQQLEPSGFAPGEVIWGGRLRILERIGSGGMADVFRGRMLSEPGGDVAVKVIRPGLDTRDFLRRFATERESLARLDNPDIARVIGAGSTAAGHPFLVIELVRGGVPITALGDVPPDARIGLLARVCRAVHHAHQRGVIHRDLKPSNLLVTRDDAGRLDLKVIDFGLAKSIGWNGHARSFDTCAGQILGTPAYMSPEQVRGAPHVRHLRARLHPLRAPLRASAVPRAAA